MSQKRIKTRQNPLADGHLGVCEEDVHEIINARAKAVVDRVVAECLSSIRPYTRTLREARMVRKFEVRT